MGGYINGRIQVYSPEGKHLRTIRVEQPGKVLVHQRTGEIYVFSWTAFGIPRVVAKALERKGMRKYWRTFPPKLTVFSAMPNPKQIESGEVPLGPGALLGYFKQGALYQVELDSWSDQALAFARSTAPYVIPLFRFDQHGPDLGLVVMQLGSLAIQ